MKPMNYQNTRLEEVLASGEHDGYKFKIISYGTHPCAYVAVSQGHPCFEKGYDYCDIDVHGGLTYAEKENSLWWLGWDYAHYGDYSGYDMNFGKDLQTGGKQWSTVEIFEEVKSVIAQLKAVQSGNNTQNN